MRQPLLSITRYAVLGVLITAQLLLPVAAQSNLPALGDGAEMSLTAERKLGDRIARELYRDPDYIDDAVLGDYVEGIWQRLLLAARQRERLCAAGRVHGRAPWLAGGGEQ